jgi:DNA polymerase III delta prime subunit
MRIMTDTKTKSRLRKIKKLEKQTLSLAHKGKTETGRFKRKQAKLQQAHNPNREVTEKKVKSVRQRKARTGERLQNVGEKMMMKGWKAGAAGLVGAFPNRSGSGIRGKASFLTALGGVATTLAGIGVSSAGARRGTKYAQARDKVEVFSRGGKIGKKRELVKGKMKTTKTKYYGRGHKQGGYTEKELQNIYKYPR